MATERRHHRLSLHGYRTPPPEALIAWLQNAATRLSLHGYRTPPPEALIAWLQNAATIGSHCMATERRHPRLSLHGYRTPTPEALIAWLQKADAIYLEPKTFQNMRFARTNLRYVCHKCAALPDLMLSKHIHFSHNRSMLLSMSSPAIQVGWLSVVYVITPPFR